MTERPMTRAEAMSLAEEKRLVEQGYEFLDEKRVILAGEIMTRLADWRRLETRQEAALAAAREALGAEIRRIGFEAVQFRPTSLQAQDPKVIPVRFLGARLLALSPNGRNTSNTPGDANVEDGAVATAFAHLHAVLADMALVLANLYRLADEYQRTERRAKALENVLIPEIVADLKRIEAQLEANEMEDAIRVRIAAG